MTHKHRNSLPSLRHHKPSGRAFVELAGKRLYLGPWGVPSTKEAYNRVLAEWVAHGRTLRVDPAAITVVEVCAAFWQHEASLSSKSQHDRIKAALKDVKALYGSTAAKDFGPNALRTLRECWIQKGRSRTYVNMLTSVVKRVFKWAVSREMLPGSVHYALSTVDGLRRGRSAARETEPIGPVCIEDVNAIEPFVSRQVWALIQLQLLTGARPGEMVGLRPCDLDTTGNVWIAAPKEHKTAHKGRARAIYFSPHAQAILRPYMLRNADAPLFSPKEAQAERSAAAPIHRRPNQKPNPKRTDRVLGDAYDVGSYRRAIAYACTHADIKPWSPHKLRHTAATQIRKEFGLEAAQLMLGHARADVTQVYAETNAQRAIDVALQMG